MSRLLAHIRREPLAAIAVVLTVLLAILQSDWLNEMLRSKVSIVAYYEEEDDGRCSLSALSIDNHTDQAANDIRINIVPDSLVNLGEADVSFESRATGMIAPGQNMPIAYRADLGVGFLFEDTVLKIPVLMPGEYTDLFRLYSASNEVKTIRRNRAAENDRERFTPRIGNAAYADGRISIKNIGSCYASFGEGATT